MALSPADVAQLGQSMIDNGHDMKNKTLLTSIQPNWTDARESRLPFMGESIRVIVSPFVEHGDVIMTTDEHADEWLSEMVGAANG